MKFRTREIRLLSAVIVLVVLATMHHRVRAAETYSTETIVGDLPPGNGCGTDDPQCGAGCASCREVIVDSLPLQANITSIDHYVSEAGTEQWVLCTSRDNSSWFDCHDDPGWARFRPGDTIETTGNNKRITAHFRNWATRKRDAKVVVFWTQ